MVGFIVQCSNSSCKKIEKLTEPHGRIPEKWIILSGGEEQERDRHFCNINCLTEYHDLMNELV